MIKNKALLGILFYICSLVSVYSCTTEKESVIDDSKTKTARVIGYLSTDNFDKITSIQFCKLTHLNIAFANPDKAIGMKAYMKNQFEFLGISSPDRKILIKKFKEGKKMCHAGIKLNE